ncbi:MAG: hypothetical protein SFX73_34110 [Kofleriaceae bacterium]|nr:hypothetical protein [Kofleriaceae bacterium]
MTIVFMSHVVLPRRAAAERIVAAEWRREYLIRMRGDDSERTTTFGPIAIAALIAMFVLVATIQVIQSIA